MERKLLNVHILSYLNRSGFKSSADAFGQESKANQEPYPEIECLLEEWWGLYADQYLPIPDTKYRQEEHPFTFFSNGQPKLASLRANRLNRFILKYMQTNNCLESADAFFKETKVIQISQDCDDILEKFWMRCMAERKMVSSLNQKHISTGFLGQSASEAAEDHVPSVLDDPSFLFKEVQNVREYDDFVKIHCCDFSSDGHFLAYGGTNNVVSIWNVNSIDHMDSTSELPNAINDVRFRPNSHFFAAACNDGIIYCWELHDVSEPLVTLPGHSCSVQSLDFWPKMSNILCSADSSGALYLWDLNQFQKIVTFQEETSVRQVRFQSGNDLLAVALGNRVLLLRVQNVGEDFTLIHEIYLEGHIEEVRAVCWNSDDTLLASVSLDGARIWRLTGSWTCAHKLDATGYPFESCVFHITHPELLIIGSYIDMHIWDFINRHKSRCFQSPGSVHASSLAVSKRLMASTNEGLITLWKL